MAKSIDSILDKISNSFPDFCQGNISPTTKGKFGDYPLHKVAMWGDIEAAAALLDAGADINAQGEDGETALHRIILSGDLGMIELLLSRGANPKIPDVFGRTAYEYARASPRLSSVMALLLGADES